MKSRSVALFTVSLNPIRTRSELNSRKVLKVTSDLDHQSVLRVAIGLGVSLDSVGTESEHLPGLLEEHRVLPAAFEHLAPKAAELVVSLNSI